MIQKITLEINPMGVVKRVYNRFAKEGMLEVAKGWMRYYRSEHFRQRGAVKYGYRKRSYQYTLAKKRKFGQAQPLVWTGESRAASRAGKMRSTSKSAAVTMRVPRLNRRKLYEELTRVTADESTRLAGDGTRWINARLSHLDA